MRANVTCHSSHDPRIGGTGVSAVVKVRLRDGGNPGDGGSEGVSATGISGERRTGITQAPVAASKDERYYMNRTDKTHPASEIQNLTGTTI